MVLERGRHIVVEYVVVASCTDEIQRLRENISSPLRAHQVQYFGLVQLEHLKLLEGWYHVLQDSMNKGYMPNKGIAGNERFVSRINIEDSSKNCFAYSRLQIYPELPPASMLEIVDTLSLSEVIHSIQMLNKSTTDGRRTSICR